MLAAMGLRVAGTVLISPETGTSVTFYETRFPTCREYRPLWGQVLGEPIGVPHGGGRC